MAIQSTNDLQSLLQRIYDYLQQGQQLQADVSAALTASGSVQGATGLVAQGLANQIMAQITAKLAQSNVTITAP